MTKYRCNSLKPNRKLYSLFGQKDNGRWHRISDLALLKRDALKAFQEQLTTGLYEIRPVPRIGVKWKNIVKVTTIR